ncbi:Hypothetical protein DPCES_3582 [Desulfitobacterium hafniense]|uniref:SbsA Ig-like domain-containing protein n=1 Tax=Desulfitobacterium hafniense TaxID=49338 RepID=A0A098B3M7_DESHA|nr:Ig-like domain-containing protein [Desulfitobacterium hafniense]CDX03468.1 Hypothetical protein DPCES_3582 [Desulfitobacterium hafniense]
MAKSKKILSVVLAASLTLGMATPAFATTLYVGNVGFDLDRASNESPYDQKFRTYMTQHLEDGLYFDFDDDGNAVDLDAASNSDLNLIEFEAVPENQVPKTGPIWDGEGEPGVVDELVVESVSAINSKTLQVNFNQAVTKASAENTANYSVKKVVTDPTITVSTAVQSADGKSVTLTIDKEMVNVANGYVLAIAKDKLVLASDTTKKLEATEVFFDGVATADTTKPAVQRAEYFAGNNTLVVKFSKPVSLTDADVSETKITIKGNGTDQSTTLDETAYAGATGSGDEITFKVPAAVVAYTSPLTVEFGAEFVQDVSATPLTNDAQTVEAATASKPAIVSATYDESTDKLVIKFNKTVDVSTLDTANVKVKLNGAAAIAVNGKVLTTTDGATVEIEAAFVEPATVTLATIELGAGAVKDLDGNGSIAQTGATLAYTDDKTAPTLVSASYNDLTNELTLEFSEKVDQSATTYTGITVVKPDGTSDDVTAKSLNDSTTLVVTPAAGFLPSATNKISIAKDAVVDMSGNKIAKVENVTATITDLTKPTYFVITDDNAVNNATYTNKVTVVFSEKVDKATAETASNYDVFVTANSEVKLNVQSALLGADGKTVTLTTDNQSGIEYGIRVSNVKDLAGNVVDTPSVATVADAANDFSFNGMIGTTDTTQPTLSSAAIVDKDASGDVSKGDQLVLTFSEALNVNFANVTPADFIVTKADTTIKDSAEAFGSGATFGYGDDSTKVAITLGTLGANKVIVTDNINLATNNDILDLAGNKAAAGAQAVTAPADAPKLSSIVYTDTNGDGAVNAGDKVKFNFNQKVNIATPTTLTSMVETLGSFGTDIADVTGGTAISNADSLEITMAGSPALVVGTTTDKGKAVAGITNGWANTFVALTNGVKITSADATAPTLVSAKVVKGAGLISTALEATDTVVLTFSEPVNAATALAGAPNMYIKTSAGIQLAYGAVAVTQTGASKNEITITIAAGDGWVGTEIDGLTFTTTSKIFVDAAGNKADLAEVSVTK